ncbi:MAG: LytTR family DNA-binding domain-containing protein [Bacteroidia bacterium]|nr:LytTR family DNA-binding domain-containing protein [Bacteroidia bacterium]
MNIIIIDDEVNSTELLKIMLGKHCPEGNITGIYNNPLEGRAAVEKYFETGKPNLLFLDIEMPYMNGFELLDSLEKINFEVVFITAYNHYAIKAFKYNAIDYLLKPYSAADLKEAFARVKERSLQSGAFHHLKTILLNSIDIKEKPGTLKKIAIPTSEGVEFVKLDQIIRCEASQNYCKVVVSRQRAILVSKNIGEIEESLPEELFLRVHKSHIVNVNYVLKYIKSEGGSLLMEDGEEVAVSRLKKDEVLKKLFSS